MAYPYCLPADSYDGDINGIQIRWGPSAITSLQTDAALAGVPTYTLKAPSENFVYLLAYRLRHANAVIMGSPHTTTTNSATGVVEQDEDHITAQLQAGERGGRSRVHIYLEGQVQGPGAYDNVTVKGESVMVRRGKTFVQDLSLCSGTLPTRANEQTAPSYSEWEWDTERNQHRRYNYTKQRWEWQ